MIAPDGTVYPNRMQFRRIEKPRLIEAYHGTDADEDPGMFRFTITFDAHGDKTVLTMRQLHPTAAQRETVIGFGAVELGYQTLDKLAAYAVAMKPSVG
jgi:uncharacterized protein YndB with AHSA1/START domain